MESSFLAVVAIIALLAAPFLPPGAAQSVGTAKDEKDKYHRVEVFDETCQHSAKTLYEISPGERWDKIYKTSLFRHDDTQLESYVGYPCNVALYNEYYQNFVLPGLRCPFRGDLDARFRQFIRQKLLLHDQTLTTPDASRNTTNSSLVFQYICFSPQFEYCKPVPLVGNVTGSCDGVCECRDVVPISNATGYPRHVGLTPNNSMPVIRKENEIRCGVKVGALCVHTWDPDCQPNRAGYDKRMEKRYKLHDFFFKCEANAGCHFTKRICQCAEGHRCIDGAVVNNLSLGMWGVIVFLGVVN